MNNLLQEGRLKMKERCCEAALAATPSNVTLIMIRKSLSGRAQYKTGVMSAPRPFTRKALYIFLHECAHFVLHGKGHKPRHVEELEAEKWAHSRMREAGFRVPRSMTERAKKYIARKIRQALARGAKHIDREAEKFAGI